MAHNGLVSALDNVTGEIRLISDVSSGEACQCICAQCRGILIARKGRMRAHHFAHKSGESGDAKSCQETALHNAAKRLLAFHLDFIQVPSFTIQRPTKRFVLPEPSVVGFEEHLLLKGAGLSLEEGEIEPRLQSGTDHRPDALAYSEQFGSVYFEVQVTHPVPEAKKKAYQALGLWVLEIDLSAYDPADIGLERLKDLLAQHANREWLSWRIPDDVQASLITYEATVARLEEKQEQAFKVELQKPIPRSWEAAENVQLESLRYQNSEFPLHRTVPTPQITSTLGYRVTESVGGVRLPVFWEPHKNALAYLDRKYQRKRHRALSCVLAKANSMVLDLGTQSNLIAAMQWVLETLTIELPSGVHQILGLERHPCPERVSSGEPMFQEKWISLWADPALGNDVLGGDKCRCADVPEAFARACILWGAADMVVLADGKALADKRVLTATGRIQNHGDVYTAIRLRCESLSPLPCRLILEQGGYSRSLDITRHLGVRDGSIYLQAMGTEIPISLTPPDRSQSLPVYMVPGLSYPDESALFKAHENTLVGLLDERLKHNREHMSQYLQGDGLLASFVAFFSDV